MWFNRHTTDRNYSGEQKVNFESPVPFSKCLRARSYSNINVHFDPQGCQTLLLKESEPFLLSLGSWTKGFFLLLIMAESKGHILHKKRADFHRGAFPHSVGNF